LQQTIAKLQDDVTAKDIAIEQLRKQVSELLRENAKLRQALT
jgi:regulator of replication initiation timing